MYSNLRKLKMEKINCLKTNLNIIVHELKSFFGSPRGTKHNMDF